MTDKEILIADYTDKIAELEKENEQLKQQIEKEKKFSKDVMNNELRLIKQIEKMKSDVMSNIKWAEQNKNNPMYCKLNSMINQWELAE